MRFVMIRRFIALHKFAIIKDFADNQITTLVPSVTSCMELAVNLKKQIIRCHHILWGNIFIKRRILHE